MASSLFISDLHLSEERPAANETFFGFIEDKASRAGALYVLGDLFEYWIGDDDLGEPFNAVIAGFLRNLTRGGVPLFLMHGNRDFLMGKALATATGATLLEDPARVTVGGEPAALLHGDTLCTDDVDYQTYRAQVRRPEFRAHVLSLSLAQRIALAEHYRGESRRLSRDKPPEIMDVNQGAVEAAMRAHGVRRLLHGHTHRQAVHDFLLDGAPAQRIVLGDWYRDGCELEYADGHYSLRNFDTAGLGAAD